jgi:hypothetical protein
MFERLTRIDAGGIITGAKRGRGEYVGTQEMLERLYEYENSNLSPEEVQSLAQAKAEGRLVVLPCKVGDSIYRPEGLKYSVFWTIANVTIYPDEIVFTDDSDNIFTLDDIGKTVFLTREEAEKALGVGE